MARDPANCLVTVNAGGTSAPVAAKGESLKWAQATAAKQPLMVCVQEVPSDEWLGCWTEAGYEVIHGFDRGWRTRSAVLVRDEIDAVSLDTAAVRNLEYHGSYVAAARCSLPQVGSFILASVHASPNPAEPTTYGWQGQLPLARDGGGDQRYPGNTLWDSDLLLETLRDFADVYDAVIAAGDFNEAQRYDDGGGSWGEEYFARANAYGLTSWTYEKWEEERPTHRRLQLDHVLVTASARALLLDSEKPWLDSLWEDLPEAAKPDHVPIWVPLNPALARHGS